MADSPASTPKIDSLRAKIEADPKSRHFYPLAEELRKIGQLDEAERVLRAGLEHHSTYLSAWISLGRTLKDREAYAEAIDVLMRGLSLDPENVVAAKLLAHVYLAMGDKVEAIKKFKLVHALMPADEEAEEQIELLDRELNPQDYAPAPAPIAALVSEPAEAEPVESPHDSTEPPFPAEELGVNTNPNPLDDGSPQPAAVMPEGEGETNFDLTNPDPFSLGGAARHHADPELPDEMKPFSDAELPGVDASESPSAGVDEDPFSSVEHAASDVAQPQRAPSSEDVWADEDESSTSIPESAETVTMAEIFVKQGHLERAQETYERILQREPDNARAREGLAALVEKNLGETKSAEQARRLESWRKKVVR